MYIWIAIYLHFCMLYTFSLLLEWKQQGWPYWLFLSVRMQGIHYRPCKCKINDALSQHLQRLVECCIYVYWFYFSTGKSLEKFMTFVIALLLLYWERLNWDLRALKYLTIGNNFWYQSILHSECVYVNWTAVQGVHEIANWFLCMSGLHSS